MSRTALRVVATLLLGLSAVSSLAAAGGPFVDVEAGGGYDGNLNAAASDRDARGDGFGFGRAAVGMTTQRGRFGAQLTARWSGFAYADYDDLSVNRIALEPGFRILATESIRIRVLPSVGGSFHGDSDRDTLDLGVLAGLRFAMGPHLWLEPSYAGFRHDARSSVFDRSGHRFSLALGAEPWSRGYVRLATLAELAPVVRYLPSDGDGGGGSGSGPGSGRRSRPNDTFGPGLIAERQQATLWQLDLSVEQALTERFYVAVGAGYGRVWTDPDDYDLYFGNASLGIRWP